MTRRHLLAVAVLGALIGLWLSPGRGYTPVEDHTVAFEQTTN